jgi:hypothetical protein
MVQSNPIKRHPLFKNHLDLLFQLRHLVLKKVGVFYDSPTKQSNAIDAHRLLIKGGVAQILAKTSRGGQGFPEKNTRGGPLSPIAKISSFLTQCQKDYRIKLAKWNTSKIYY